jgi:hypothetical protein
MLHISPSLYISHASRKRQKKNEIRKLVSSTRGPLLNVLGSGRASSAPLGWADKPAEKYCWLIYCKREILFRLKKQVKKDGL